MSLDFKNNKILWRGYTTRVKKILTAAVIVTIKDDPIGLARLLKDLSLQTTLPQEIVLVFAGLDTQSETVINAYKQRLPIKILRGLPTDTRAFSRNQGVAASNAHIILFTDAGCRLHPDWISELTAPFSQEGVELVSGYTEAEVDSEWEAAQAGYVLVPKNRISAHPLPATRNMAILKSTFEAYSGFDNKLNFAEDFEFARRLQKGGVQSLFAPNALVTWKPRPNLKAFFLMILHLTAGDILSGSLRLGHATMWMRYLFFVVTFLSILSLSNLQNAIFFLVMTYGTYLGLKIIKCTELSPLGRFWILIFQPTCDLAVLSGTVLGLVWRLLPRENRE